MVRAAPRVGARLATFVGDRRWCVEMGGGEPLIGGAEPSGVLRCSRHGSLRPSGSLPSVAGRTVHKDPVPVWGLPIVVEMSSSVAGSVFT